MTDEQTRPSPAERYAEQVVSLNREIDRVNGWLPESLVRARIEHEVRMHPATRADLVCDPASAGRGLSLVGLYWPLDHEAPGGSPLVLDPSMERGQIDLCITICPPYERKP